MSGSSIPFRRSPPTWLKVTAKDLNDDIYKLSRKGLRPAQIGVILRDSHGVAQVRSVTGKKILRVLKALGTCTLGAHSELACRLQRCALTLVLCRCPSSFLAQTGEQPAIPEDLYFLVKKAVAVRKHMERNRKDKDSKFRLILIESRIHRLARYYRLAKTLPPNWK